MTKYRSFEEKTIIVEGYLSTDGLKQTPQRFNMSQSIIKRMGSRVSGERIGKSKREECLGFENTYTKLFIFQYSFIFQP